MVKDLLRTFDNASLNNPTTNMAATDEYLANDASDVIAASAAGDDNDVSDDANVGGEVCRRLPHGTMQHDTSLRGGRGRERIAAVNQTQNNDRDSAHYDNEIDGVRGEARRQVAQRRQPSFRRQDQVLGGPWTDAVAVRRSISQSSAPCAARSSSLVDRDRPPSARYVTSSASLVARRQAPRDDRLDSRQLPRRRSLSSASLSRQQQQQQQQQPGRSRPNRQASH